MFYGSVDGFVEYHDNRGREIPATWSEEFIESTLLVASEWLDAAYSGLWSGTPTDGFEQVRQWPREHAKTNTDPVFHFPDDAIPERVEFAAYEAAFRQGQKPGSLQKDFTPNKYRSVRIDGAISVDYNLNLSEASDAQTSYPVISSLMAPLLNSNNDFSGYSGKVSRV
jgi:hypothetical protein